MVYHLMFYYFSLFYLVDKYIDSTKSEVFKFHDFQSTL